MIVYDVATKVLDTEKFPQYTIADLYSSIYCFVQSGEIFTVKGNTHTRTHTVVVCFQNSRKEGN